MNHVRHPSPAASLDIDILRSIVAIDEEGSVASAADRVSRTPAAISMQVKKLEDMLGHTLFQRTRQGMTPTADGIKLLEYARRMIELNREAIHAFSAPELEGEITIGLIDSFGGVRLAEVFAAFARSHPKVTVNVSMGCTVQLAPLLADGTLDLALLTPGGRESARADDLLLREEPLAWIAKKGGRAAKVRPLPLAVANDGCAWRKLATDTIKNNRMAVRIAYVSDYDAGQLAAAEADLAIAPMPRSYLRDGLVELGARDGLPPLGQARIVLRMHERAQDAAYALASRIAEGYGKTLPT